MVPRGAFGSGEHETTASCLEILEELDDVAGSSVLDVGCGTGVLAVAALKLGAAEATGIDISHRAAATSVLTARINGVGERLNVAVASLAAMRGRRFSLVLANLYADVLLAHASSLVAVCRPKATIILSGIAWESGFLVRQRFEKLGCTVLFERWLCEYVSMALLSP